MKLFWAVLICLVLISVWLAGCCEIASAESAPNFDRLANAIYYAEGGNHTRHPYGILAHYHKTTARQACITTLHHQYRLWLKSGQKQPYIEFLGHAYCPVGASNDPTGLNKNWIKNVSYYYNKGA